MNLHHMLLGCIAPHKDAKNQLPHNAQCVPNCESKTTVVFWPLMLQIRFRCTEFTHISASNK